MSHSSIFQDWPKYRKYTPLNVRLGVLIGESSEAVRYIEFGDQAAEPLYLIHSLIFPSFENEDVEFARNIGRRIIVPVRRGALADDSPKIRSWNDYIETAKRDLNTVINTFSNEKAQVDLISLVSGGAIATGFALDHPKRVKSISYVSTCYSAGNTNDDKSFLGSGFANFLSKNRRAGHAILRYIRNSRSENL